MEYTSKEDHALILSLLDKAKDMDELARRAQTLAAKVSFQRAAKDLRDQARSIGVWS